MGSRLLAAAVVLGTILSAVLLGVMLAAPLISQPAALAPVASETPAPSEAPAEGLPPLGLYLLRGADSATLPLGLFRFASASSEVIAFRWDLVFAHVVLTSLPLVIVYLFVQRRLVQGLSEGAIRG